MRPEEIRIVFMGTPEFAVETLKELFNNHYNVVGVITVPDKPAGRGREIQMSPVKKFSIEYDLKVLQPEKLKSVEFLNQLHNLNADLQVVVGFRMLPEVVWKMPKLGTFNLHASLLPHYRGAAPINWVLINGEKETGITTFFIQQEIDAGNILFSETLAIEESDDAGTLHDKLMYKGARLVIKTIESITNANFNQIPQNKLISQNETIKLAPKIFKENCKIDWNSDLNTIYNFVRGLSPYPAAWTEFKNLQTKNITSFKIYETQKETASHSFQCGKITSDNKHEMKIAVKDGFINIKSIQQEGKKRLNIDEFLRGFKVENYCLIPENHIEY